MPDTEEHAGPRPGRCANHPAVAQVGKCDACGRPLCIVCAVPVRGRTMGPECLSSILGDVEPAQQTAGALSPNGDRLALVGFGLVLLVSLFPWSRFGGPSHFFGAWTLHWSMVAALAALAGLAVTLVGRYRFIDARVEAVAYVLFGLVAALAAVLHHQRPPLLSDATSWPLVAVVGATIAVGGGAVKLFAMLSLRRAPV